MEVPRGMEPTGTNGRTRHTLSDPLVGRVSSCGGFLVGWQGTLFLVVTTTMLVRRLICLRPLSGSRTATTGIGRVAGSVAGRSRLGVGRLEWFCGGHGPGETPGPFPNPEAKAWHGDGTALERVWESSAPPHSFVGGSRRASAPGTPILFFFRCPLPAACGRLPFHNTPRITWSASVTVINDVMRLTRYVRAGSRESRYDGKRHKPDD